MTDRVWISEEQETVADLLRGRLASDPDSEYLDVCGVKSTAAEVASTAHRIANTLAELGVGQGDRVASLVENSSEAMLAWWGIVIGGAVAVPVKTADKGDYLRHHLLGSGSALRVL